MKRILITGANSYIGTSFYDIMSDFKDEYIIDTIDMIEDTWRNSDFSRYDCVFHVAGIAHIKETKKNSRLYYEVNRDLAIETATKAKTEGVKQFIILSSMSVYGIETGFITKNTVPCPSTNYGKSKLQADETIFRLCDDNFQVVILRPPMVYGKGCKGNYISLSKYAKKMPIFPSINNERSMIYIKNLVLFIKKVIDETNSGLYLPQNAEYINTSNMVNLIAKVHGKKLYLTKMFNPLIVIMHFNMIKKVFGTLVYEKVDICDYVNLEDSIFLSEE